jgi:hypothetical protein
MSESEKSRKGEHTCLAIAFGLWGIMIVLGLAYYFGGFGQSEDDETAADVTLPASDRVSTQAAEDRQTWVPTMTARALEKTQEAIAVTQTIGAAIQIAESQNGTDRWGLIVTDEHGTRYIYSASGMPSEDARALRVLPATWRTPDGVQPRYQVILTSHMEPIAGCGEYVVVQIGGETVAQSGSDSPGSDRARVFVDREKYAVFVQVIDLVSSEQVGEQTIDGDPPSCPWTLPISTKVVQGDWPLSQLRAWLVELLGADPSLPEP